MKFAQDLKWNKCRETSLTEDHGKTKKKSEIYYALNCSNLSEKFVQKKFKLTFGQFKVPQLNFKNTDIFLLNSVSYMAPFTL